jgi:hypothetical protein
MTRRQKWWHGRVRKRTALQNITDELDGLRARMWGYKLALFAAPEKAYPYKAVGGVLGTKIRIDRFERYRAMVKAL